MTIATKEPSVNGHLRPEALNPARIAPPQGALLLTGSQLATLLGFSPRTIKRMTAEGRLPGVVRPYGRSVRYCRRTIEDWIARGCPTVKPARGKR
jgi:excisionase family DNA binding protein